MPTVANVKRLPENGGRAFALLGHSLSFKAEPEDTDDALFLFEHRMPPALGVPAHTERNHEAFYVLEGTLEVEADGERYRLGTGERLRGPQAGGRPPLRSRPSGILRRQEGVRRARPRTKEFFNRPLPSTPSGE